MKRPPKTTNWKNIDWTKTNVQLSVEIGIIPRMVSYYREKYSRGVKAIGSYKGRVPKDKPKDFMPANGYYGRPAIVPTANKYKISEHMSKRWLNEWRKENNISVN